MSGRFCHTIWNHIRPGIMPDHFCHTVWNYLDQFWHNIWNHIRPVLPYYMESILSYYLELTQPILSNYLELWPASSIVIYWTILINSIKLFDQLYHAISFPKRLNSKSINGKFAKHPVLINTFKYHVFAPMGRFQLHLIYLYFPPSSHLIYVCFCPVGLSLL